jgi:hypothetical protein
MLAFFPTPPSMAHQLPLFVLDRILTFHPTELQFLLSSRKIRRANNSDSRLYLRGGLRHMQHGNGTICLEHHYNNRLRK